MSDQTLGRLLVCLDVAIEAFAICEVRHGVRLLLAAEDTVEVHYVLSGRMHMACEGARAIMCGPGSMIVLPPGVQKAISTDGGPAQEVAAADHCRMMRDGLLLFDAAEGAEGDLRVVCGAIMANVSGSFGLLDSIRDPLVAALDDIPLVRQAFEVMLREVSAPGLGARALTGALMKSCLVMLLRRHLEQDAADASPLAALRDPRLARAISAVLDHAAAPHTVASLASLAGMSRSSFARAFTAEFDMSPMEFVARTRLHHAAELLRSTLLPVKVIAGSIGFASRSHFTRAFRQAYGADPRRFRQQGARPGGDAPGRLHGSRRRFALAEEPKRDPHEP